MKLFVACTVVLLAVSGIAQADVLRLNCHPWERTCKAPPGPIPPCPDVGLHGNLGATMTRMGLVACMLPSPGGPNPTAVKPGTAGPVNSGLPWKP
jgi:hypothetical protein